MTFAIVRTSRRGGERRAVPFDLRPAGREGTFAGYASLFGVVDQANDMIMPGAFRRALARRGQARIKMLYQHLPHEPIGVWTHLVEDARGLRVEGRLCLETTRGREVRALVSAGALDGLSIGFRTVRARTDARSGVRLLHEVDLWEISLVTFPMLDSARVQSMKRALPPAGAGRGRTCPSPFPKGGA